MYFLNTFSHITCTEILHASLTEVNAGKTRYYSLALNYLLQMVHDSCSGMFIVFSSAGAFEQFTSLHCVQDQCVTLKERLTVSTLL